MPRSGTTLLRKLLNGHKKIGIPPETHYFSKWMKWFGCLDLKKNNHFEFFFLYS